MLQLADSTVRYLARIAKDILMKIWGYFVPVDFVVLDMETTKESASTSMAKKRSLIFGPNKSNAP
jgi:hypothetical protein